MEIIESYYNETEQILEVTFTADPDGDYLNVELPLDQVKLYSPIILEEEDIMEIDFDSILEILESYFEENTLPSEGFF
jgi:hypothetical protein